MDENAEAFDLGLGHGEFLSDLFVPAEGSLARCCENATRKTHLTMTCSCEARQSGSSLCLQRQLTTYFRKLDTAESTL